MLQLLSQGRSDKEVAKVLGLSDLTTRTHRTRLLRKAGVNNVCALLYRAYVEGWIALPDKVPG